MGTAYRALRWPGGALSRADHEREWCRPRDLLRTTACGAAGRLQSINHLITHLGEFTRTSVSVRLRRLSKWFDSRSRFAGLRRIAKVEVVWPMIALAATGSTAARRSRSVAVRRRPWIVT